ALGSPGPGFDELAVIPGEEVYGVAVDEASVYFAHYDIDGGLEQMQLDGGARTPIGPVRNRLEDLAALGGQLGIATNGDGEDFVRVVAPPDSPGGTVIDTGHQAAGVVRDGNDVFIACQLMPYAIRRARLDQTLKAAAPVGTPIQRPTGVAVAANA